MYEDSRLMVGRTDGKKLFRGILISWKKTKGSLTKSHLVRKVFLAWSERWIVVSLCSFQAATVDPPSQFVRSRRASLKYASGSKEARMNHLLIGSALSIPMNSSSASRDLGRRLRNGGLSGSVIRYPRQGRRKADRVSGKTYFQREKTYTWLMLNMKFFEAVYLSRWTKTILYPGAFLSPSWGFQGEGIRNVGLPDSVKPFSLGEDGSKTSYSGKI